MKLIKHTLLTISAFLLMSLPLTAADLNIATLDPQAALFNTNVAKKELEELENSDEWKEVVEELQAKATEARDIQDEEIVKDVLLKHVVVYSTEVAYKD